MDSKEESQLKVALYLRVSTDDQLDKYGIPAQRDAIENLIKSKGKLKDGQDKMILAGEEYVYIDDISGTVDVNERPAFCRLKEDYINAPEGSKPFNFVAVYRIDRFARKVRILMNILNFFERYKIEFISASESIDTSTPFGRAMLGILGVIAELEMETIKERTQRGREQAIQGGIFMGANSPYGYKKDEYSRLEILKDEAKVVKDIFNLFVISKLSPQKIAKNLKDREISTPEFSAIANSKRKGEAKQKNSIYFWRPEKIRDILSNEIYVGIRYYNKTSQGKRVPKAEWKLSEFHNPEIILPPIFDLAQQRLEEFADRKTLTVKKEQDYIYLLSALLKCDHCKEVDNKKRVVRKSWTGGKKKIGKEGKYSYYYFCNKKNVVKFSTVCSVIPIPADEIENYIVNFIKRLLENPYAVYQYQRNLTSKKLEVEKLYRDKEEFEKLLSAVPQRRTRLLEQHEHQMISSAILEERISNLKLEEERYRKELDIINFKLSQEAISKGYEESFRQYAGKYGKGLEKIINDKKQLYEVIHDLIYQIIIYSRQKNETDVIAGRKKENQFIPEKIDIQLNLPQDLLRELYVQRFGVKSDNL